MTRASSVLVQAANIWKERKDLWDLIFFLSDTSSKESETEIFIAVYVSDFFPLFSFKERPRYLWVPLSNKVVYW